MRKHSNRVTDLWALPERYLSHSMADIFEKQFYSRCPEHVQPALFSGKPPASSSQKSDDLRESSANKSIIEGKAVGGSSDDRQRQSALLAPTTDASTQTPSMPYSQSRWCWNSRKRMPQGNKTTKTEDAARQPNYAGTFFGALHATFLWRWWFAGLLKLIAGECFLFGFIKPYLYK